MSDNWLREEEKLLELISNNAFHLTPLNQIAVSFVYIDSKREVVHIEKTQIRFQVDDGASRLIESNKSILAWPNFQAHIHLYSKWNDKSYVFEEASLHHIPISYEIIDIFKPSKTLQPLPANQDCKIEPALAVFHDLSEIFVIMREAPLSVTKSILKTGGTVGKTKKVRIAENEKEVIHIPLRTKKRITRKIKCKLRD